MEMNTVDIVALIIMGLIAVKVTFKGFVHEFESKSGIIIGLLLGLMFSTTLAPYIEGKFHFGQWSYLAAFSVLFITGFIAMKMILSGLNTLLDTLHLRILDYLLGFALGAAEGALIVSVIIYLLQLQQVFDLSIFMQGSRLVNLLQPIAPIGIQILTNGILFQGVL